MLHVCACLVTTSCSSLVMALRQFYRQFRRAADLISPYIAYWESNSPEHLDCVMHIEGHRSFG